MNYAKLSILKNKLYFGRNELEKALGITSASARVLCSRYVKKGYLLRLKRGFYTLSETWDHFERAELFALANILQVPSYVSFMTALSYYEMTTQVPRKFFECACLKRTKKINIKNTAFNYYKLKTGLYSDFVRKNGFFIATKEKALMDTLYLFSFGKYKFDLASLDVKKFDKNKLGYLIKKYPLRTRKIAVKLCKI